MELYARVNILDGTAVRLPKGDISEVIHLDEDPVNRARGWVTKGADRLHVVDLNAAVDQDYSNRPLIEDIIKAVDIPVQVGGGIRSQSEIQRVLAMGAWRVVIGTLAIVDQVLFWELNRRHPYRIVVALDVKDDLEIVIKGWTEETGEYLEETLIALSSGGAAGFMISEVGRDALIDPPNYDALAMAVDTVDEPVIAAGGVRNLEDVERLMQIGSGDRQVGGLVVGREVTAGRFTMDEIAQAIELGRAETSFGPWSRADLEAGALAYSEATKDAEALNTLQSFVHWMATNQ